MFEGFTSSQTRAAVLIDIEIEKGWVLVKPDFTIKTQNLKTNWRKVKKFPIKLEKFRRFVIIFLYNEITKSVDLNFVRLIIWSKIKFWKKKLFRAYKVNYTISSVPFNFKFEKNKIFLRCLEHTRWIIQYL